jgi:putative selenate reductase
MRVNYEDPLQIRQAKFIAAENAQNDFIKNLRTPEIKTHQSAAVIGAGPAGIAAAVFLRRNGVPVKVYEKREKPFGAVQYAIPSFRISEQALLRDFEMACGYGVEFIFNAPEHYVIAELQKKHQFVVLATGAWKEGEVPLKQEQNKVIGALRFLEDSKKNRCNLDLGKRVAVIGGGDVAMDCARAAKRNRGVQDVVIVYRRTREFMPAQYEEQELALADGVVFKELLSPVSFSDGTLCCEVMRPGAYDESGRRQVEGTGKKEELHFDTVISAVGARVDTDAFVRNGIALNDKGFPAVNTAGESSIPGVYIAGDGKSGAATVVRAIADGKAAAADILRKLGIEPDFCETASGFTSLHFSEHYAKKGIIAEAREDNTDACRCLSCDTLCEICADVCPNRANVMIEIAAEAESGVFTQPHQIVHIDQNCNECGNCAAFCPHAGKPYKDKLTVFSCGEDFVNSENPGFLKTGTDRYRIRREDKSAAEYRRGETTLPDTWLAIIETIEAQYGYLLPEGE